MFVPDPATHPSSRVRADVGSRVIDQAVHRHDMIESAPAPRVRHVTGASACSGATRREQAGAACAIVDEAAARYRHRHHIGASAGPAQPPKRTGAAARVQTHAPRAGPAGSCAPQQLPHPVPTRAHGGANARHRRVRGQTLSRCWVAVAIESRFRPRLRVAS